MGKIEQQRFSSGGIKWFLVTLLVCAGITTVNADVANSKSGKRYDINIPSLRAVDAFNRLADQTETEFLYPYDIAEKPFTSAVKGKYTVIEALNLMLESTELSSGFSQKGAIRIFLSDSSSNKNDKEEKPMFKKKRGLLAGLAALAISASSTGQDGAAMLEEIIVSAEKRDQSAQDLALSVSVVSGDAIDKAGLSSVLDVTTLTPGVIYQDGNDQRISRFAIRGISTPATFTGNDPSSAIMLDGEVFARSTALHNDLVDIARVEVLKGPQGTLFGKNVAAGALHIISNRPNLDENSAFVRINAAQDSEYKLSGTANLVLSDSSALRFNAFYKDAGGWVENLQPGQEDGGASESKGFRAQLLHEFSDNLDLLIRADYSDAEFGPGTRVFLELDPTLPIHAIGQTPFGPNNTLTRQFSDRNFGSLDNLGVSAELSYDFGEGYTLTYAGYYRNYDLDTNENFSATLINVAPNHFAGPTKNKTMQHEVRIASPVEDKFNYVVGAFYFQERTNRNEVFNWCQRINDPATVIDPVTFEVIDCGGLGVQTNINNGIADTNVNKDNYAIFGQANYGITDQVNLIAGVRFLQEDQDFNIRPVEGFRNYGFYENTSDESKVIGRLGIQYYPTDSTQIYATYSTGYKGVAFFNTPGFQDADAANDTYPTDPEETSQFEIGLKSDLLGGRVRLNLAAYELVNEGFQERVRSGFDPAFQGNVFRVTNVPELTSKGIDLELSAALNNRWTVSLSGAYIDSEVTDGGGFLFNGGCRAGTESRCVDDNGALRTPLQGSKAALTPDLQFNISSVYELDLSRNWTANIRADYRWLDDQYAFIDNRIPEIQDSYGITDLYFNFVRNDERYNLSVFVKNAFDKQYYTFHRDTLFSIGDPLSRAANAPRDANRYFGFSGTYNF